MYVFLLHMQIGNWAVDLANYKTKTNKGGFKSCHQLKPRATGQKVCFALELLSQLSSTKQMKYDAF